MLKDSALKIVNYPAPLITLYWFPPYFSMGLTYCLPPHFSMGFTYYLPPHFSMGLAYYLPLRFSMGLGCCIALSNQILECPIKPVRAP